MRLNLCTKVEKRCSFCFYFIGNIRFKGFNNIVLLASRNVKILMPSCSTSNGTKQTHRRYSKPRLEFFCMCSKQFYVFVSGSHLYQNIYSRAKIRRKKEKCKSFVKKVSKSFEEQAVSLVTSSFYRNFAHRYKKHKTVSDSF